MPDLEDTDPSELEDTDRFRIVARIGDGGMGVVYEAIDRDSDQRVALKTLKSMRADALLRFKQEFRSLRDIRHPNLVSLGELIEDRGTWFFTMELVDGQDFLAYVRTGTDHVADETPQWSQPTVDDADSTVTMGIPPSRRRYGTGFDEARLRSAFAQLAAGVSALHAAGKVHRDIKPSNIRVTPDGRVVLLDFGLVRAIGNSDDDLTASDRLVGTVRYMAPEQAATGTPVGPAADWYSVGVLLYQSLTGRLPFDGPPMQVLMNKQRSRPVHPRSLEPDLPDDLAELCIQLLATDPADRPTERQIRAVLRPPGAPATEPSRPSVTRSAVFVGRARELDALQAAYEASRAGAPVVALVCGESGIGKSALVQQFIGMLTARDARVVALAGRCFERESVPYKAVDELMDALVRHMHRLPAMEAAALVPHRAALLADVFPVLRQVQAIAQAPRPAHAAAEPRQQRAAVFRALRELFVRFAERRPLVLAIDDLQWADADSLALLADVLRPPDAPPLLLVATLRPAEPGADTAIAALPGDVRRIDLSRLADEEARELAELLLRFAGPDATLRPEDVAAEAAGHPLFIHELVHHCEMFGAAGGRAMALEDALWARVERLDPLARRVVELVVLANGPIALERIAAAAQLEFSDVARAVGALRVAYLVRSTGNRRPDTVEVYHDRIRQAVARHMTAAQRRDGHRQLALALESAAAPDADALAMHWQEAGDAERAARYALAAGDQAAAALAFDRAATRYRTALACLSDGPDRHAALVKLGDALANAGRGVDAARAYQDALPTANRAERLELQRRAAEQLLRCGHLDEGLDQIRSVLDAVGMTLPRTSRAALLQLLWRRLRIFLRGLRYRPRDESELSEAELRRIDVCWSVAAGLSLVDPVQCTNFQARHTLLALAAGEQSRIARALGVEAAFVALGGHKKLARAERLVDAARAAANASGDPHAVGMTQSCAGMVAFLCGDVRRARAYCEPAEEILRVRCTGALWELMSTQVFTMWALFFLGELRELARRVPAILAEALDRGDLYASADLRMGIASFAWLVDDAPDEAERQIDEAIAPWSQKGYHLQHYYELIARAHIDLYRGEPDRAWRRVEEGWRPFARSLHLRIEQVRIEAVHLRGRCALAAAAAAAGEVERARLLREVLRIARRLSREAPTWAGGCAALLRAGVHHLRGETGEAATELRKAIAAFDQSGHGVFGQAARARLATVQPSMATVERAAFEEWCARQRLPRPERIVAVLVPGFD
ncbi:MAG: serine/threonine-protein kinase PknK [Deltaproteobacteria bacterium]|nr:MAG: serine/threonine-protein kinase PknK [Deltaproteobacteria bacterium]